MIIAVYVGSRANFGRLKCVLDEIIGREHILHIIEGSYKIPNEYRPFVKVTIDSAMMNDTNENMARTVSLTTLESIAYFKRCKPDFFLIHGDRFENLGPATAASYIGIPIGHIEAGDVSGNIDDKVRNAITALSDVCFAVSSAAEINCLTIGKPTFLTGSPGIDLVKKIDDEDIRPVQIKYYLVAYNPCPGENFGELIEAVKAISEEETVFWVNPNIDPGNKTLLKEIHKLENNYNVEFLKDIGPLGFLRLMKNCEVMLGNSSAGIKEGAYLGVPFLLIGNRQNGRKTAANTVRCRCNKFEILSKLQLCFTQNYEPSNYFGDGTASQKIIDVVERWVNNG
jgi:UDP-hydrolysing UDP-N-acetyl-D-glucosamine 2-epimerase